MARWLLSHFGCSPNNDAVIGDLDERYRAGRSRMWYSQQTLRAIVMSFFQEVWSHKLLAVRALFFGWAIKYAWLCVSNYATWITWNHLNASGRMLVHTQWFMPVLIASVTASVVICACSAWFVSRISGPHYRAVLLLYVLCELLAVPISLIGAANQFPAKFIRLWASPFATYFYFGLGKLGYPFESVIALWCGCILMALTMLLAGRIFIEPSRNRPLAAN